jgi:hypothetical protein
MMLVEAVDYKSFILNMLRLGCTTSKRRKNHEDR